MSNLNFSDYWVIQLYISKIPIWTHKLQFGLLQRKVSHCHNLKFRWFCIFTFHDWKVCSREMNPYFSDLSKAHQNCFSWHQLESMWHNEEGLLAKLGTIGYNWLIRQCFYWWTLSIIFYSFRQWKQHSFKKERMTKIAKSILLLVMLLAS